MKNKTKLLLAMCIGVLKVAHDSGKSKIFFILAMAIAGYAITLDYKLTAMFMVPLIVYVQETGYLHKLNKENSPKANWKLWGYAYFVTLCFMAPIAYHLWYASLPLLLWPVLLRYLYLPNSKWWWACTFALFFSYSLLFFISL
jgi:hypothetical protein